MEYTVHLHLGDDDAYGEHKAHIEQGGQALPLAPDGHFDLPYTVEDEVRLPMVTDDPSVPKPVREGMSFVGWVECAEDGTHDSNLVPSMEVVLPVGSHGDRHYRAVRSFALRFEVPSAVGFRFDLADDDAFADALTAPCTWCRETGWRCARSPWASSPWPTSPSTWQGPTRTPSSPTAPRCSCG